MSQITPYRIEVPEQALEDLRDRLARTRWPDELPGGGWEAGTPVAAVRALADYWRTGYDWRAHEARLNALPQYTTEVDGESLHFLHVPSREPGAVPLVLLHGWPGSVVEFLDLIGPLTDPRAHGGDPADAFHLVVPSLPGFGFSGPTRDGGWNRARVARAVLALTERLGYGRFAVHGGDFGALVARELGILAPERVLGVHVLQLFAFPSGDAAELAQLGPDDHEKLRWLGRWQAQFSGYAEIQSRRPQTLAFGLADSPAGLLAWLLDMFDGFGDNAGAVDRDALLTDVTIYWATGTIASSMRIYREDAVAGAWEEEAESRVPTAVLVHPRDFRSIRTFAERANAITRWTEAPSGGHYGHMEEPEAVAGDLRAFARGLR